MLTAVLISCPGSNLGDVETIPKKNPAIPNSDWNIAAIPFLLTGETAVTNMKVMWIQRSVANRYEVYRDGVLIGSTTGDRWDDYGLEANKSYSYQVKAYLRSVLQSTSSVYVAETFTPAAAARGTRDILTASTSGSLNTGGGGSSGPNNQFKTGGVYYQFQISTSGSGASSVARVQGRASSDNSSWSSWVTLKAPDGTDASVGTYINPQTGQPNQNTSGADLTGIKLESTSSRWVGPQWVYTAHREEAAAYNLGHLFIAQGWPGDAWGDEYNDKELFRISTSPLAYASGAITFDGRPMGLESRDMSVYVDDDGSAYALCSGIQDISVHLLTPDWREPSGVYQVMLQGQNRETPHFLHIGDYYYLFSSWQNGWLPTQTRYVWLPGSLTNKASALIPVGGQGTFGSQYNRGERFRGSIRDSYGMWGYRWENSWPDVSKESDVSNPQRIVPVVFNKDYAAAAYFRKVACYADYGLIGIQTAKHVSMGKSVTRDGGNPLPQYSNSSVITDGRDDADADFVRGTTWPYTMTIDLETPAVIKEVTLTIHLVKGSDTAARFQYHGSNNGTAWTQLYDGSSSWVPGFVVTDVTNATAWRYFRITIPSQPKNVMNSADAGWAEGIIEVAVYGTPQ